MNNYPDLSIFNHYVTRVHDDTSTRVLIMIRSIIVSLVKCPGILENFVAWVSHSSYTDLSTYGLTLGGSCSVGCPFKTSMSPWHDGFRG